LFRKRETGFCQGTRFPGTCRLQVLWSNEGRDSQTIPACVSLISGKTQRILTPLFPVPGLPDVLQQRGGRGAQRDGGVQVPVRLGAVELPRERPAALHPQPAAQR